MTCVNCGGTQAADPKQLADYPFCRSACRTVFMGRLEKSAYGVNDKGIADCWMNRDNKTGTAIPYPDFLREFEAFQEVPNRDYSLKVKPYPISQIKGFLS
jgi:endogenous inhibitor of DNA gyrase (YacG/DUF329 family)